MAIEDTLYALERAFQNNAVEAAVYLKQVPSRLLVCSKVTCWPVASAVRTGCASGVDSSVGTQPEPGWAVPDELARDALRQPCSRAASLGGGLRRALFCAEAGREAGCIWRHKREKPKAEGIDGFSLGATSVAGTQVRTLCGRQFYARALGMKIAALQHAHGVPGDLTAQHAQRSAAAPGPAGRSVQLQIGDSWASTGLLSNPLQSL